MENQPRRDSKSLDAIQDAAFDYFVQQNFQAAEAKYLEAYHACPASLVNATKYDRKSYCWYWVLRSKAHKYFGQQRYDEAEKTFQEIFSPSVAWSFPFDEDEELDDRDIQAKSLHHLGKYVQSSSLNEETLSRRKKLGQDPGRSSLLLTQYNLARDFQKLGRYSEAIKLLKDNIKTYDEGKAGPKTTISGVRQRNADLLAICENERAKQTVKPVDVGSSKSKSIKLPLLKDPLQESKAPVVTPGLQSRSDAIRKQSQSALVMERSRSTGETKTHAQERHASDRKDSLAAPRRSDRQRTASEPPPNLSSEKSSSGELMGRSGQSPGANEFFDDLKKKTHELLYRQQNCKHTPVGVAILDSGLDGTHDFFQRRVDRIGGYHSWVEGDDNKKPSGSRSLVLKKMCKDVHGHGTHMASLVLSVNPLARIYIARVCEGRIPHSDVVAKAIEDICEKKRNNEWQVDMINLSFGFEDRDAELVKSIGRAAEHNILIFAAASNFGGSRQHPTYPASDHRVFCILSAKHGGVSADYNISKPSDPSFAALGEKVNGAWPTALVETQHDQKACTRLEDGTSPATAVATGIASLILEFAKQRAAKTRIMQRVVGELTTLEGMKLVFESIVMKEMNDGFQYIAPWILLDTIYDAESEDASVADQDERNPRSAQRIVETEMIRMFQARGYNLRSR